MQPAKANSCLRFLLMLKTVTRVANWENNMKCFPPLFLV